jgi:FkbM family methyltransferase
MPFEPKSLIDILDTDISIDVVDIGANPIDGDPPYKSLLGRWAVRLVGFEPNPGALKVLNQSKGPNERYLPYAIADGARHTLRLCEAPGMTSLLEPNTALHDYFHGFSYWQKVLKRVELDTKRLDDVVEIERMDYLKIDIQGGELMAFQSGQRLLSNCFVIHTEIEFLPLYVNQPLFSEVELFLRSQGFIFHRFWPNPHPSTRIIAPMVIQNDPLVGLSQATESDVIFIKDFTKLALLSKEQLLKFALILHDIYSSYDIVLRILTEHDDRSGTSFRSAYLDYGASA